ncbi:MAG: epoxyqueuosine reductase QueH [Finegoldia sp.]|nr:epoxyqueuosine reductase QueH [Finegoldia sp.]
MEKINYQKILDKKLEEIDRGDSLLLHSCCGPCSSYVLEYLSQYFKITVLFYNPNIYPSEEYYRRAEEEERLIGEMDTRYPVDLIVEPYHSDEFYKAVKGYEDLGEKSQRCYKCYELRLKKSFEVADKLGISYLTTTLSISPHKNANWINEIGKRLEKNYKTAFLCSDFKKKDGYKRSIKLSKKYGLYRQDYCGCVYSKNEAIERSRANEKA